MNDKKDAGRWSSFDEVLNCLPGGTDLNTAVLREMVRPHVNPWAPDFVAFFEETLDLLKRLLNTRQDVLVMLGPIRAAMDAVVCSLIEPGDRIAVAVNGYWSELFTHLIRAHGGEPVIIARRWGLPVNPQLVAQVLDRERSPVKALIATHIETSTGAISCGQALGQVARERGLIYVLDCAQSLGGVPVQMDQWGVDFCLAGSHKCMSSPAGLAFVGISADGWRAIESRGVPIKAWYGSLLVWREVWMRRQPGYFTFSSSILFGLRSALDQIFARDPEAVYHQYATSAKAIRLSLRQMGLDLVVDGTACPGCDTAGQFCANTVTAVRYPAGLDHEWFAKLILDRFGIAIAGTYGELALKAFRVGPTGLVQIQPGNVIRLVASLGLGFQESGGSVDVGAALSVADSILKASRRCGGNEDHSEHDDRLDHCRGENSC